ncbi:hypothetical protein OEG88_04030 [Clostridium perfringens]|uniref:hypothetical protein n=1 Tax=Clostridium perfringens TaxID=1502 RepID=UPI00110608D6|nr:hypothetical protein [Clostridium perfringens]EJT5924516.1 hypothetical protein [Clostridium perfringens]UYC93752.1 hypothetical protein OEG88_04030 [Clostridium perfringens]HAT4226289.1 hypothetical protein [Clostridium perfringens]HBI6980299.1 hypothetical protein [Clostridium perfringens]HBI7009633.1 hypothetical protein [Clostridium perfringens]
MAKKKLGLEDNSKLPKPKVTWVDGKPFITNGWIDGSYFEIKQQPSIRSIEYVNEVFAENAHKCIKEKKIC